MSIGDALAAARREAGLTITQVSHRTCVRETIIRGIERGDYSGCGGDFYARGHIRNIARAVGADPEPLVREYDASLGPPEPVAPPSTIPPGGPTRLRERRAVNWTAAVVAVLLVLIGFGVYRMLDRGQHARPTAAAGRPARSTASARPTPAARSHRRARKVIIALTAVSPCWIQLTTASGRTIFTGLLDPGTVKRWTEHRPVRLELGNPAGVKLTVNGKNAVLPAATSQPVTLTVRPRGATVS
jgi:cytoskeletal protein RodZ